FFFFQAEDGIRDSSVTGVQTCALPISTTWPSPPTADCRPRSCGCPLRSWHPRNPASTPAPADDRGAPLWRCAAPRTRTYQPVPEIGRASCRERVDRRGVVGCVREIELE